MDPGPWTAPEDGLHEPVNKVHRVVNGPGSTGGGPWTWVHRGWSMDMGTQGWSMDVGPQGWFMDLGPQRWFMDLGPQGWYTHLGQFLDDVKYFILKIALC